MIKLDLYNDDYSPKRADSPYGISAGAVVYKNSENGFMYLVLGRDKGGSISYHLPKGTLHLGETLEACAVREIAEEAGVHVRLKTFIGGKQVVFDYQDKQSDKVILYYVAEYIEEAEAMDDEHDFREWCSYEDIIDKLETNIKQENIFVARAYKYLRNHG